MTESIARRRRTALAGLGRSLIAVALLAVLVGGVLVMDALGRPVAAPVAEPPPEPVIEPAAVPPGASVPEAPPVGPGTGVAPGTGLEPGADSLRAWADQVSAVVDIPARAVVSYVNADLAMRGYQSGCQVSWATLAGIGRIESDHGRFADALLGEDGRPTQPIIGVALDGAPGVQAIADTDGGVLDGDAVYDRAVGPMQFIPSTWQRWSTDGNNDGIGDPQSLDDAAMAAARYLCADGRDLTTGDGWWAGVMSYNNSVEYGQKVFALAESYAEAGRDSG